MNDLILKTYAAGTSGLGNIRHFFKDDERGVTAVEYAIVLAGVAAVVAVIFGQDGTVQTMLEGIFSSVESKVNASMTSTTP
ncbi:Flp family type IVb pilin [Klebsiella sp. RHBSTW-00484]|uniref:Flp family type IVb pilin n=1 Tax=unclassified Klebsiella TaxID=2608929 RepID=UPI0015E55F87|nr:MULTISPECIES: Flp family type IVb pilin [unclassified Klebsiella]MBA7848253.1 Flp family type IVb pilin [Klebsiella sp. RHBSTW-00465]QLO35951.1 Flp family type IVb pilin [Klebsiella sp. RHBSTW-00484]QLT75467.1 Flp family type IVb pilin [Klebsiella sp. RHBSTW-00464]